MVGTMVPRSISIIDHIVAVPDIESGLDTDNEDNDPIPNLNERFSRMKTEDLPRTPPPVASPRTPLSSEKSAQRLRMM